MSDADRPADVREEAAQMAIAEALEAWEEEHGFWGGRPVWQRLPVEATGCRPVAAGRPAVGVRPNGSAESVQPA